MKKERIAFRSLLATPLMGFVLISFGLLVYIFYTTPLREQINDYFYDVITRLTPADSHHADDVLVVEIDQQTVAKYGNAADSTLAPEALAKLVDIVMGSQAKSVALLLLYNVFDYEDPTFNTVLRQVASDKRFAVGTLGYNSSTPSLQELPSNLQALGSQVHGIETLKVRSNSIVRVLPKSSYRGSSRDEMLPVYVAGQLGVDTADLPSNYRLEFVKGKLPVLNANELLAASPAAAASLLKDKIIIVGYTLYKEWPFGTADQMIVNTPLKGEVNTHEKGEPITLLTARAIENLYHGHWLKPAPSHWQVLQTALIGLSFLLFWALDSLFVPLLIVFSWLALLTFHVVLFRHFHIYLPLADTVVFSSMAIILGALTRINYDLKRFANAKVETEQTKKIASIQARFLDRFAVELAASNAEILQHLEKIPAPPDATSLSARTLAAGLRSCQEFGEYLRSIQQFSQTQNTSSKEPLERSQVDVSEVVAKVLARFDTTVSERGIDFTITVVDDLVVSANANMIDTVLFNFVSNAIKYSPKGAEISIKGERLADKKIRLSVSDRGKGIPAELQERVFEKFYRIKDDDVYTIKGTGLGLYLCKYFADRAGATVGCESAAGQGSTFYLEITE